MQALSMNSPHIHLDATRLVAAQQQRPKPSASFACPELGCNRTFYRRCTLSEHLVTHTGEKPYVCRIQSCGKRFSTSGNLSRHKRLHGPVVPLKCPAEGCACTFASEAKLENHMKYHFGTSVHMCPFDGCGNTYSTIGNLKRHLRIHHDNKYQVSSTYSPATSSPKKKASSPTTMDEFDEFDNETEFNDSDAWIAARMAATEPSLRDETSQPWEPEIFEALLSMLDDNDVAMQAV